MITTLRIRTLGVLLAAALTAALVPALPAVAAPTGSATLTAGTSVFPSPQGETRDFTIEVSNEGMALLGESINWIRVQLPASEAGVHLDGDNAGSPPSGWSATATEGLGSSEFITYTADSSSDAISPGSSLSFTFPADVARPVDSEESGGFTVAMSSDNGETTSTEAGEDLSTTVEILEIVGGISVTSPDGATDGTATGGQSVQLGYSVRNHAQQSVSVTGELTSDNPLATVEQDTITQPVPGDPTDSTPFEHLVSTSTPENDTTVRFAASATAPGADADQTPEGTLTLQVPSVLDLDPSTFSPDVVRSGMGTGDTTFTIDATQDGSPDLTVDSGSLSFAGTTAELVGTYDFTSGGTQTLEFALADGDTITGTDGSYDVSFSFPDVTDENGFTDDLSVSLAELIRIDNLAPILTLDVEIPDGQTAVKNGDTISVTGTIDSLDAETDELTVTLNPDVGESVEVPVSASEDGEGGYTFSGEVSADFEDGRADDSQQEAENPSNPFAKTFDATASVPDAAGNLGTVGSDGAMIDNVVPALTGPGRTGVDTNGDSIITVFFDDTHPQTDDLAGGCDPGLYRVDGLPGRVSEVRAADGGACDPAQSDNGTRTLVLDSSLEEDETPTVTYAPGMLAGEPVTDGAVNSAVQRTIDTVIGIAPAPPELVSVTRNDGAETAYSELDDSDEPIYYTRFDGEDLQVTFAGFEDDYFIQVLDGSDNVLKEVQLERNKLCEDCEQDHPNETGERTISIPLGEDVADGAYARSLRFRSPADSAPLGVQTDFTVVLDTAAPVLAGLSRNGQDVTVTFDDVIVAGSDFASDWFGWEDRDGEERYYQAETVTTPEDSQTERLVTFGFEDPSLFGGVHYLFTSNGERYEDRAGNTLADQRLVS